VNCYRCHTPLPDEAHFCLSCGADVSGDTGARATVPVVELDPDIERKLQAELEGLYHIERELGRGGMGAVYLATEVLLGRKVAIKVLPPAYSFGEGMVERFKREARTAATLDHPHVIPIYRVSEKDTLLWYAMKYIEGETLAERMEREGPLPVEQAGDIVRQVADALAYAHRRGVIHRDIKPANIMIDPEGWVMVTDFGIAKATGTVSITGSGSMLGTPYYMSPEQCAGTQLNPAADQYSLAVVAYQMLTGSVPFPGESVVDVIKRHCFDTAAPITAKRPDAPQALATVIATALAKKADERFPDVQAFSTAFTRAARGEALDAAALPVVRPAPPSRRRTLALASAATLVVAALAVFGWIAFGGRTEAPTVPAAGAPTRPAGPESAARGAAAPAQPAAPETGRLLLQNLPSRAAITVDGRAMTGPDLTLAAGPHTVVVSAAGFRPFRRTVRVVARETQSLPVQMVPDTASGAPAPGGMGRITVGSLPSSAELYINGERTRVNPVADFPVRAGAVVVRFRLIDSTGAVVKDTSFTVDVRPGQPQNVGRVRLRN
jgi:hypothetical protein